MDEEEEKEEELVGTRVKCVRGMRKRGKWRSGGRGWRGRGSRRSTSL